MAGFIHIAGVIFYYFFASGELQPWAEPHKGDGIECVTPQSEPIVGTEMGETKMIGGSTDIGDIPTINTHRPSGEQTKQGISFPDPT